MIPNPTLASPPHEGGDPLLTGTRQLGPPGARDGFQHLPPAPPQQPPPSPPYQSRDTTPRFFRARSTTEGGASIGAAPKLKSSFRWVKTVGIWLVLCEEETQTQRQRQTVRNPQLGADGWPSNHLPVGENWRIWDSGAGVG